MQPDTAIVDFAASLFLRYFRSGSLIEGQSPTINAARDVEMLKGHWAISQPVRNLIEHILDYPHEAQALLMHKERIDDAVARGRIDARRTVLLRQRSGLPTAIASMEPVRSFNTGPNVILAWVLKEVM
ncbi:MAG: hypothetical protein LCH39_01615 [Proteobacteria bacterium]|nr:hypothetical protein [Pseudomonadota bacterium]